MAELLRLLGARWRSVLAGGEANGNTGVLTRPNTQVIIGRMTPLEKAISKCDGVGKLAAAIGVGQSVVSNWKARGTDIDPVHCVSIERATDGTVTRRDLRPADWQKIWPEIAEKDGA